MVAFAEAGTPAVTTGATSIDVSYSGLTISAGDLLVIYAGADGFAASAEWDDATNKPSGYTLINFSGAGEGGTNSAVQVAAWYKVATGSESGTENVPIGGTRNLRAVVARYTDPAGSPIHVLGADYEAGNATSHAIDGHTTTVDGALANYVYAFDSPAASTVSNGWTEQVDESGGGVSPGFGFGTKAMATAGATLDADVDFGATSNGLAGFTFSLAPAGGGGGGSVAPIFNNYNRRRAA